MSHIQLHTPSQYSQYAVQEGLATSQHKSIAESNARSKRSRRKINSHDRSSNIECREDFHFPQPSAFNPLTFDSESILQSMSPRSSLQQPQSAINFVEHNIRMVRRMPCKLDTSSIPTKPSTPKHSLNVQERFYDYQTAVQEKLIQARAAQAKAEAALCPFKPTTRRRNSQRSAAQVYKDLMKFETRRVGKLKEQRQLEQGAATGPFRPEICRRSQRIVETRPYMAVKCEDRLYEMYKPGTYKESNLISTYSESVSKYSEQSANPTHTLKLTKLSRELVRTQPIEERLYNEALRRRTPKSIKDPPRQVSILEKSLKLLVNRFLSEFQTHTQGLDESVNYSRFVDILRAMGFVQTSHQQSNEQTVAVLALWNQLAKTASSVPLSDLKVGLMAVMGYYQPWMSDSSRQALVFTETDVRRYHYKYAGFFKNRSMRVKKTQSEVPAKQVSQACCKEETKPTKPNSKELSATSMIEGTSTVPQVAALQESSECRPSTPKACAEETSWQKQSTLLVRAQTMNPRQLLRIIEADSPSPLEQLPSETPQHFSESFRDEESFENSAFKEVNFANEEDESRCLTTNGGPTSLRLSTIYYAEGYITEHDQQEAERLLKNIQGVCPK